MASPSERYAAARDRSANPALTRFRTQFAFELDDFQVQACRALDGGSSVLVCAPTGAGKTVVGEFAVHLALEAGAKCFYTTPIKALSNQKYSDLIARYGPAQVGLLTGDVAVNAGAPVVVMTTEVLRNMLYTGSDALTGLAYVVMDEVHYLGDRFRGAVWEEVIIHLQQSVKLVSLSATVSNAEEFGEWLVSVRGHTAVIVHEERPVPLWQHVLVDNQLFDLFDETPQPRAGGRRTAASNAASNDPRNASPASGPNAGRPIDPALMRRVLIRSRFDEPSSGRRGPRGGRGWRPPDRAQVVTRLDRDGLLPAITFIFSRAGCDAAARQCVAAGLWLTTEQERAEIDEVVDQVTSTVAPEDLEVLGYWEWRDALRRGVAAHHAGLIPPFKQAVETLFVRGLVRAVFATETLALGINMPARTVVLERLSKFNGETHADVTPGEYTQLTGRAGRRGIDVEGHAVVLWSPEVDPQRLAGLASTRTYPLRSSFRPSYNMVVNLADQLGRRAARDLLEASFAQFQADRSVAGLAAQIRRNDQTAAAHRRSATCELGDFLAYAALRQLLTERESLLAQEGSRARRGAIAASVEALRRGDVIRVPRGRRSGLAVVLDAGAAPHDDPRPLVVTAARWAGRLSMVDFPTAAQVLANVRLPKQVNHRSLAERREIASQLHSLDVGTSPLRRADRGGGEDLEVQRLRRQLRAHPCHGCQDREEHARWAERAARVDRENDGLRRRIEGRTSSLARTFDRICVLLERRGYLLPDERDDGAENAETTHAEGGAVDLAGGATADGRQLARIWSESDLLTAECLRAGVWEGLQPAELAAVVSSLVYEPRREELMVDRFPTPAVRDALLATTRIWSDLQDAETGLGLPGGRAPDFGFVWPAYRWARGDGLDRVLSSVSSRGGNLPAGDFIRWSKQLVDLLGQLDPGSARVPAVDAVRSIRRGIVGQSMRP